MLGVQAELFAPPPVVVGTRLRVARWLSGHTQLELAKLSGLSATAVSEVECGKRSVAPETFADFVPTAPSFLCREPPCLEMVEARDGRVDTKATYLIGVIVADLHAHVRPLLHLDPSPMLVAPAAQPPARWAANVRDELDLARQSPIADVIELAEKLGVFVVSTGSQTGPLFVAGMTDGGPIAAVPTGPDSATRRWATACAIGAVAASTSGEGHRTALRLGAELLIPTDGLSLSHRSDRSCAENAAWWGVPEAIYDAVARHHGLESNGHAAAGTATAGWEQSRVLATVLARLRRQGVRLADVSGELGYPTSVLRGLVRGLALASV